MDDYLLELLKRQENEPTENPAVLDLTSVQVAPTQRESLPEATDRRLQAETEQGFARAEGKQSVPLQATGALLGKEISRETAARLLTAMDPLQLHVSANEANQNTAATWEKTVRMRENQWVYPNPSSQIYREETDPEALSLFFERDARRYS